MRVASAHNCGLRNTRTLARAAFALCERVCVNVHTCNAYTRPVHMLGQSMVSPGPSNFDVVYIHLENGLCCNTKNYVRDARSRTHTHASVHERA